MVEKQNYAADLGQFVADLRVNWFLKFIFLLRLFLENYQLKESYQKNERPHSSVSLKGHFTLYSLCRMPILMRNIVNNFARPHFFFSFAFFLWDALSVWFHIFFSLCLLGPGRTRCRILSSGHYN